MKYECDVCGRNFQTYAQLGGHRGGHTRRKEAPSLVRTALSMQGKCPDCGKQFDTSQKLAGHRRLMHSDWETFKTDGRRKARLLQERGHRCECCKLTEWREQPIPLHLDHKDGDPTNGTKENLQLLCPNCHAQTDTYCGKNIGRAKCARREKKKFPNYRSRDYLDKQLTIIGR